MGWYNCIWRRQGLDSVQMHPPCFRRYALNRQGLTGWMLGLCIGICAYGYGPTARASEMTAMNTTMPNKVVSDQSLPNADTQPHTKQPAVPSMAWSSWPVVGKAQLSWWMFDVYKSQLRTPMGRYDPQKQPTQQSLALEITYQRKIDAADLLRATQEQWQHLGYSYPLISQGIAQLTPIFPSVKAGNQLSFVIRDQRGQFYFRTQVNTPWQPIGSTISPQLTQAFIAIWLSPNTAYPDLRSQLLGEMPASG